MSVPQTAETVYYPALVPVRDLAAAGDWTAVVDQLEQWRSTDVDALAHAVSLVAGVSTFPDPFDPAAHGPVMRALHADRLIMQAWEIRTSKRASEVTDEQWKGFREHLVRAELELMELAALDPTDPTVATSRLTSARGLSLGLSECQRRYERVRATGHEPVSAQRAHLGTLAPRWLGSSELMADFARDVAERSAPGAPGARMVAAAQIEQWVELGDDDGFAYLAADEQREAVLAAADKSVWHADYVPGFTWVNDHSEFLLVHCLAQRWADAAPHLDQLGDYLSLGSWIYLNDPEGAFLEFRDDIRAATGASA